MTSSLLISTARLKRSSSAHSDRCEPNQRGRRHFIVSCRSALITIQLDWYFLSHFLFVAHRSSTTQPYPPDLGYRRTNRTRSNSLEMISLTSAAMNGANVTPIPINRGSAKHKDEGANRTQQSSTVPSKRPGHAHRRSNSDTIRGELVASDLQVRKDSFGDLSAWSSLSSLSENSSDDTVSEDLSNLSYEMNKKYFLVSSLKGVSVNRLLITQTHDRSSY